MKKMLLSYPEELDEFLKIFMKDNAIATKNQAIVNIILTKAKETFQDYNKICSDVENVFKSKLKSKI